jgi:plasmid stability protein
MPTLHVRNVPDALYSRLKQQAQAENRSLSAEVIMLLDRALAEAERGQNEVLDNVRRRRFFRPDQAGAPDSASLLRQDRAR